MAKMIEGSGGPTIPEVFRRARKIADLTQEEIIAAVPGLTQSTYSRFELGQADLDVSDIFKIKDFLDKREPMPVAPGVRLPDSGSSSNPPDLFSGSVTKTIDYGSPLNKGVSLRALLGIRPVARWSGKLTDAATQELEYEYAQKEADELDRQLDEELPALREKVKHYEMLLKRDSEAIGSLMDETEQLKATVAALKMKLRARKLSTNPSRANQKGKK